MIEENTPAYPISVVAELLGVHPETLRIWERKGIIKPARKNKQRLYSPNDLKRLEFVNRLIEEKGLNLAGVTTFLQLYPCWDRKDCPKGFRRTAEPALSRKPCWLEEGTYCHQVPEKADLCKDCQFFAHAQECEAFAKLKTNKEPRKSK